MRALIVEDEEDLARALRRALSWIGLASDVASICGEAAEFARLARYTEPGGRRASMRPTDRAMARAHGQHGRA